MALAVLKTIFDMLFPVLYLVLFLNWFIDLDPRLSELGDDGC